MKFFTIGVYNSTESDFFKKLRENNIDAFCDIRQRRGVRGAKYSFVNSNALQRKLKEAKIKYYYIPQLAPTNDIRRIQKLVDLKNRVLKRERNVLSTEFIVSYKNTVLNCFDFVSFIEKLEHSDAKNIVLFCVEGFHAACHRSIVSDKLLNVYNYKVRHL